MATLIDYKTLAYNSNDHIVQIVENPTFLGDLNEKYGEFFTGYVFTKNEGVYGYDGCLGESTVFEEIREPGQPNGDDDGEWTYWDDEPWRYNG